MSARFLVAEVARVSSVFGSLSLLQTRFRKFRQTFGRVTLGITLTAAGAFLFSEYQPQNGI